MARVLFVSCWLLVPALAVCQEAERHWSYQPVRRPPLPQVHDRAWPENAIDFFALAELERQGLRPTVEADRTTLIRRATLAITGLPPTLDEIDAFLADRSPDAYEKLVRRLLAAPRYGENMAVSWLDLARYADTHGYHMDAHREMWPWRDWVITALNANMPFDRFTVEQLAGDLLPGATLAQRIASGFNRNNMINFEGGAIAEEFLVEYAVDRVVTTSTVWLGQTMQCARCHDHKYDPFTQRDFFRLYAFFNQLPEKGIDGDQGNAAPRIAAPDERQRRELESCDRQLAALDAALAARRENCDAELAAWEKQLARGEAAAARPPADMLVHLTLDDFDSRGTVETVSGRRLPVQGPAIAVDGRFDQALLLGGQTLLELQDEANFASSDAFSFSLWVFPTTRDRMTLLAKTSDPPKLRGYLLQLDDGRVVCSLTDDATQSRIEVRGDKPLELAQWQHLLVTYDGSSRAAGVAIYADGRRQELHTLHDDLQGSIGTNKPLLVGRGPGQTPFRGMLDELRLYARRLSDTEAALLAGDDPIAAIVATRRADRTQIQQAALRNFYLENRDRAFGELKAERARQLERRQALAAAIPTTMVMQDVHPPRATFVLLGGQYDQADEQVTAGTPAALPALSPDAPANRLSLARWLVDPQHPLTARVAVNRAWQHHFGVGLVRTAEDFGTRGEAPSHPALLDWLADEFVRSGWDLKRLHFLIVTSATYRQSSRSTPALRQRDPHNRLLARGPRLRLSAEAIRDSALAVSGLLHERIGGPSVFPYQPEGLWEEISYDPNEFTAQSYVVGEGEDLYRRSLYTFWKRSLPPPALAALGAPSRETCIVTRPRSNTPLDALVLMNETGLVEAARHLAQRMMIAGRTTDEARMEFGFRLVTGRKPLAAESEILLETYREQLDHFRQHPADAVRLIEVGASQPPAELEPSALAAWTTVANLMLSLDEAISRN